MLRDRTHRTVAVIGASADRAKFGNKAVRAYADEGYTMWPVNPRGGCIEDHHVYESVDLLPDLPHRASIYLHEEAALGALDALAALEREHGTRITLVYLNPGADTPAVVARADNLGLKHAEVCSIRAIGRTPDEFPDDFPPY